jgi:hypothetical protein
MSDEANSALGVSVDQIFSQTVADLRNAVADLQNQNNILDAKASTATRAHVDVIDIELVFKSVTLDGNSTLSKLLWADKQTTSTLQLTLSTRIRCD